MHIRRIIIFSTLIILLTIFINPLSAFRNSESKAIEWDSPPTPPIQASTCACAKVSLTATVVAPAHARKEEALSELEAAKLLTADKHTLKKIDKAIKHIQKSLDPKLWVDDSGLDAKHGHKVFDEEKKAVKHLMRMLKDKKEDQAVKDRVQAAIDKLMKADELLADTVINDAKALGSTDPKVIHEIEKAEKELAKAKEKIVKKRYDRAVDHFKKAWKHAQHAIKKAG